MSNKGSSLVKKLKYRNYEMYKYFSKALEILSVLNEKTYEAYIIGGAVRDMYLNVDFTDIDIATNATPQTIKKLFSSYDVDMQYEHLGSVVLKIDGFRYDVTTFRSEEYVKHRLKSIHYSKKLIEDVVRRDFTINALAMSLNMNVIDLVKGENDLAKKTIRVIGNGKSRFKDDPTRILRGFHLVSKFNFKIESKTEHAMVKNRQLLSELSNYKLITLLKKILSEKYSEVALKKMKSINVFKFLPKYAEWLKLIIKNKKLNYIEQFTLLFRILENIPVNTGFTHKELVEIKKIYELVDYVVNNEIEGMDIIQIGVDNLVQADKIASLLKKDYVAQGKNIKKIYKKLPVHSVRELKISVDEIRDLLKGDNSRISLITSELLLLVINGVIKNKYSELEEAAMTIIEGKEREYAVHEPINCYSEEVEENERILALLEHNKAETSKIGIIENTLIVNDSVEEKTEEIIDVYHEEIVENNLIHSDNDNNDTNNDFLKKDDDYTSALEKYKLDFNELYRIHKKNIFGELIVSELSEEEIAKQENIIREEVKKILIDRNELYKQLSDRGII